MKDKVKVNIELTIDDKYNLLKDGPDYEEYSKNLVKENSMDCNCSKKCNGCRKN